MASSAKKARMEQFAGDGYDTWKVRIETLLAAHGVREAIEQDPPAELAALKRKRAFKAMDEMAKALLVSSIADSHLKYVQDKPTAKAMWASLANTFGKSGIAAQNSVVAPTSTVKVNVPTPKPLDTSLRSRRLMKELKEIEQSQHSRTEPCFTVELINDNLYEWHARLYRIDPDSPLAKDLVELNIPFILLHLVFPENFPFAPPFMRVVEPCIEKGFVMAGGAICMELLTPRGWSSVYTIEAILMQFASSVVQGQGRVSQNPKSSKYYSRRTAEKTFQTLVQTHEKYGWATPALKDG
ncbi:ubiquitin-conjugating enzyme E2Q-like protein 1 [Anopheles aquasalis]|uniref:ubiquitin-conjugating enzyme E2Q-like protein 1 n=1 Tax=Anopheles aquasalis TaxID=42839 RepID=UPI00215B363E|nr:ubiquitin-conjugating enzyme E2Q-like protein 1 [Anopheles aquasalis]XP_050086356.1 ubiquitin-conjugating enzyme E2Q-like protein 1 [Anopheles aquasalis]